MVEELLELLIGEVNTQLLEAVELWWVDRDSDESEISLNNSPERVSECVCVFVTHYNIITHIICMSSRNPAGTPNTYVENLETSNIQDTNEVSTLLLCVQSVVTLLDEPFEETIEDTLAESTDGVVDLVLVTTLGDELVTDLDAGLKQVLVEILGVDTEQLGDLLTSLDTISLSLLLATSLFELHGTHVHDSGSDLVDVVLLLLCETQDIEGLLLCAN
jgi:hypothetical protein